MNFLKEMWAVILSAVLSWLSSLDNNTLSIVVNLLTILVIVLGLIDWCIRKFKQTKASKDEKRRRPLDLLEGTQKPFKAVRMLDAPTESGEKIGEIIEYISHEIGGNSKMKKFLKWVWYNKEQLLSIAFNVIVIALANIFMFTGWLDGIIALYAGTTIALILKIAAAVLGVGFTALTVRNVCVKYGLSSLATIDQVLEERAQAAANKLTPEQKTTLRAYISALESKLEGAQAELTKAEASLLEINALYNVDRNLVANYSSKKTELERSIAQSKSVITNVEAKLVDYRAQLAGKAPFNA